MMKNDETLIARALTWRYVVALTLVAVLTTAAWISLRLVISEQKSTAAIVNVSGRQRMLSQRTALFSSLLVTTPVENRPFIRHQLKDAADLMQRSHLGLTRGNDEMGLPSTMSPVVHGLYFDGVNALDRQVGEYLDAVKALLQEKDETLTPDNPRLQFIIHISTNLLVSSLDNMVRQYQREGEEAIRRLLIAETAVWILTLFLLALEAFFIFRPFAKRMKNILAQLQHATDSLFESRERLRVVTENATDWLWEADAEGVVTEFSSRWDHLLTRTEVVGRKINDLLDQEHSSGGWKGMVEMIKSRQPYRDVVFPMRIGLVKLIWVRASGVPKWSKTGEFLGYLGLWSDTTESQRLEEGLYKHKNHLEEMIRLRTADLQKKSEELIESEEKFRLISSSAKEAILIIGTSEEITYWNPAAKSIFGYTEEEALGKDLHGLLAPPRYHEAFRSGFNRFRVTGQGPLIGQTLEVSAFRKSGEEFPIEVSISAFQIKGRWQALGIIRDVTERKRIEENLRQLNETLEQRVSEAVAMNMEKERLLIQQSRLAAMGEMIGNIAHQWRQPLNALGLLLANIKDAYEYHELNQAYLDREMVTGRRLIDKMSTTIDDFRNFFKPNKAKENFGLTEAIDNTLHLVRQSLENHGITIHVERGAEISANGFPNEFSQVLLNIFNNTKDALLERQIRAGEIHVSPGGDGKMAWVTIRDNAGGIADDILPKVFDPYFTTKEKGTGIGLYMSKMIMEHMDGTLTARNVGQGAEFRLTLPKSADEHAAQHSG